MTSISPVQQKLLELIKQYLESGEVLSVRGLQEEMGFKSPRSISYHLDVLEKEGFIERGSNGKITYLKGLGQPNIVHLPLLGSVPCGEPFFDEDNIKKMVPLSPGILAKKSFKDLFLVRAVGDSMEPEITEGDYVIAQKTNTPDNGQIAIAGVESGNTIKVFKNYKNQYILEPLNKKYAPFIFKKTDLDTILEIRGVVIGAIKQITQNW